MREILRRRYKAVMANNGGASAAEFALVLPILLLLVLGTLQAGMMMFSYNVMVSAARDAARAMAVCTIDTGGARAQSLASKPPWLADADWQTTATTGADVTMAISVDAAKAAILSYVPFGIGTLTANVTMRKEPLAFGGGSC